MRSSRLAASIAALFCAAFAAPSRGATWYGLVDTGELFASTNQGVSWSIHAALPVRDAVGLAAGSSPSELYLASRTGVVYRSTNAGVAWNAVGTVSTPDIADLLVRADLSILLLAESGGIYRSTNSGTSFTAIAAVTASNFVSLTRIPPSGAHYALTATGEVYESIDGGIHWIAKGTFAAPNAVKIRATPSALIAITSTGDTYRSTDAGVTWPAIGTLSQVGTAALAIDGATIVAALETGEVATSPTGATWTWQGAMNQLHVTALATDAVATTGVEVTLPASILLGAPWPNPSLPGRTMSLAIELGRGGAVTMELIDIAGRRVARRAPQALPAGRSTLTWNPGAQIPGFYTVRVQTDSGEQAAAKWVLVR